MYRRGYIGEYHAKKHLIEQFGEENVLKVAISQKAPDYIILKPLHAVEVKTRRKSKYTPREHDIEQWKTIYEWSKKTKISVQYYILTKQKGKYIIEKISLSDYYLKYVKIYLQRKSDAMSGMSKNSDIHVDDK